jgi:PAS domain S-box-containing protein
MAFTNDFHGLLWSSFSPDPAGTNILIYGHGAWFWINVAYSYALMVASTILLAVEVARYSKFYRRQTATVLIGSIAPWIGNAIYVFGFDPLAGLDLAPVFFSVCGIIITFGIYRFGLFNIVPVAREVVFNSMRSGVIVLDGEGRIVEINLTARKILEVDVPLIGKTARGALPEFIGKIQDFDSKLELNAELCLEKRASPICLDISVSPLYDGVRRLVGRVIVLSDVTEREKVERKLRETSEYLDNLIGYANAPITVWDPEFRITRFNKAFERITGKTAQEVFGKHLEILFPNETKAQSLDYLYRAIAGERWETVEIPILHVNGTVRTLLWNSANVYKADGKTLVSTIAQGQDITERKKAEEAKAELEAVKRTSKMKDQFIALVTHELHIPLAALKGYTEMLLSGKGGAGDLTEVARGLLETIARNADRLTRLTDSLLDVQIIESGTMAIEKRPVKLKEILERCAKNAEGAMKAKRQDFEVSIGTGGFSIEGDAIRLETVFAGILDNASKFTPDGGKIRLDARENENEIKVAISDTGIGIPKDALARVFEPFASITKPDYFRGAGLSLSVAKGIVEAHGGTIKAESEGEGKGATFTVTLPKLK